MSRGFFAVGIYQPKREVNIGTLWRTAAIYDAAFIFTIGHRYTRQAADTTRTERHTPLFHYPDMSDFRFHVPRATEVIAVETDITDVVTSVPLPDLTHPTRAVYLLGAEDEGLPPGVLGLCDGWVHIPTPAPWSLNVAVAGSIVLHDRHTKTRSKELTA